MREIENSLKMYENFINLINKFYKVDKARTRAYGGSGIGLMDIWSLKKKYAASLHIYEYQPGSGKFTKKISLVFDHKKHYLIRSYRSEELVRLQTRSDLYILPLEEASH